MYAENLYGRELREHKTWILKSNWATSSIFATSYIQASIASSRASVTLSLSRFLFSESDDFHRNRDRGAHIAPETYLLNQPPRLRWNNDEWLMHRLQPAGTITGSVTIAEGEGKRERSRMQTCCVAQCASSLSSSLSSETGKVFSVSVELRRSLYTFHPEHILRDERGYGFEETKRRRSG